MTPRSWAPLPFEEWALLRYIAVVACYWHRLFGSTQEHGIDWTNDDGWISLDRCPLYLAIRPSFIQHPDFQ